jgi:error-prone DNA polymerase
MRGVSSPDELCAAAAKMGMRALALTDVNGVYGSVRFWETASDHGLRPILGADVITDNRRAVLLAESAHGYERMCEVLTGRHLDEDAFSLSRALSDDREGLVILSGDTGFIETLLKAGVREDIYVALPPGKDTRSLLRFAKDKKLTPVAVGDVYFTRPEQYGLHKLLRAIDQNTTLSRVADCGADAPPAKYPGKTPVPQPAHPHAWLASPEEMARRFPHCPEAIKNAEVIAERCVMAEPPWKTLLFPDFRGLGADEAFRLLRSMCLAGARRRYGRITPEVRKRLDRELSVIREKGFAAYFLVVEDIVRNFPITCGRGSAAASIVSYCLMITHVDPVRHNLFFERFLNPGRVDPPDIDVDFPWDTRDQVLDYVFEKYGDRNAAMVSNHVGFQARAAVREIAKVYGMPEPEIKRVTGRMRGFWKAENAEEMVRTHPIFKDLKLEAPWPEILKTSAELEGIPRHLSVHCGGVVIAPGMLTKRVPLQKAPKGVHIIQWEKDQAEDAGLVKIDLLGNRSLAVIRDALCALKKNQGVEIEYSDFDPVDDPDTVGILAEGDSIGVFYVESPAMRLLQKKTGRGDFERLVVHSSIIRPAANEFIREYVRRLHGGEYEPLHPLVEDILSETFGIMTFQEDVCKVVMALAGFNAVDGDGLRKVMSKKHKYKKLMEYREQFYKGASARGVSREVMDRVWEMIMSFSGYSFCKPHSASYALVSFKSAWLRAHHPAKFMASVISNQGGYYRTFAYVSEAKRMGIEVFGPDVNESFEHYTGKGMTMRVGLMQLKGLSKKALERTVEEREAHGPYESFDDFLRRTDLKPSDARLLVKAGCFDSLEGQEARPGLLWKLAAHEHGRAKRRAAPRSLFDSPPRDIPRPPGYTDQTMLRHEVETLGFLVSRHPLTLYLPFLKPLSYVPGKDLEKWVGRRVHTVGWYVTGKLVSTRHHEPMEFFSFEDTTAIYETTFFPETYRRFIHLIDRDRPVLLHGLVEQDFGAVTLTVDHVKPIEVPRDYSKDQAAG